MHALRLVMSGSISPQELERVLPPDVLEQVQSDGFSAAQNGPPQHLLGPPGPHNGQPGIALPPHQPAGPSGMDPMLFWMPPPLTSEPLPGGFVQGRSDFVLPPPSPPSAQHRSSSITTVPPVSGLSSGRGRTRSVSRRTISAPTSPILPQDGPETPAAEGPQEDQDDMDPDEDKRRRNTAASGKAILMVDHLPQH
jgi:hypothetical protein